jgi:putative intracellular protease/amidase
LPPVDAGADASTSADAGADASTSADAGADASTPADAGADASTPADAGTPPMPNTVLVFVPGTQAYWSEYKVMVEALQQLGFGVEVRSSHTNPIASYMTDTNIEVSANSLAGGNYALFKTQYQARFGAAFQDVWSAPGSILPAGRIQDVADLSNYRALVIVGGVGALQYRYDGSYASTEYAEAAAKLQALATQAIDQGIPILAQCHAGTLPIFFRAAGTQGTGPGGLGTSILAGRAATAYHLGDGDTAAQMTLLGVGYRAQDPVVLDGPVGGRGASKVITSRDWYPQTVAYAAATLGAVLRTYPTVANLEKTYKVLVLEGGPVNTANCSAANRSNDVPCNYGTNPASVVPADGTTVRALLEADSANDAWSFTVTNVNLLAAGLPFDPSSVASVRAELDKYDAVLFFKHWNTGVTPSLMTALRGYVDDGGGLVGLHHALYNDAVGGQNKDPLVDLFGAGSAMAGWSARAPDTGAYRLFNTSYGHFVSGYGVAHANPGAALPAFVSGAPLLNPTPGFAMYSSIVDEIYNNMAFMPGVTFGRNVNQVEPLLANNVLSGGTAAFTSGFARERDLDGNGVAGRLVYLEPGERRANFSVSTAFGQMVRNAVVWSAQ